MIDVLIIAHFTHIHGEAGNCRFQYIAERLLDEGKCKVEVVTSSFSHHYKMQRKMEANQLNEQGYRLTMLNEPGYSKNISLKRFFSHHIFGKNLSRYLNARGKKPNVVYCAIPSLDVGIVAAEYCKKNDVRFIIDIQDLWPEAFEMVFNVPIISNLLYYPLQRKADKVYASADEIIAVSETYANRASRINKKCTHAKSVFLGTDLNYFDKLAEENKVLDKPENEIWVAYVGTLGHSYDLDCVIDALALIKSKHNIKFIVMGDGPLRSKFQRQALERSINAQFTGKLDYGKMIGLLTACDIAVNPIRHRAAGSIINKHGDYAAAGLPVLNTQECAEYRKLLESYNAGFNCNNSDPVDLSQKLLILCENQELRKLMGKNSRKLAEHKFDRQKTYSDIINKILGV